MSTPLGPSAPPGRQRRERIPLVLAGLAALAVLLGSLLVPLVLDRDRPVQQPRRAADPLAEVTEATITGRQHTDQDVTYHHDPPMGGPHARTWLACGAYLVPVRDELAVHDLEHGTVWITYDPGLAEEEVAGLRQQLPANGILSPYPGLRAPVVATVWGAQLRLEGPEDERLALFIEEYGDGHTAPEPGASCRGGVRDPDGGRRVTEDETVLAARAEVRGQRSP